MDSRVIATKSGKVQGSVVELKDNGESKLVHVYRKIPFAKPPTGKLRFMPPQPADPWNHVIDGTVLGKRPAQANFSAAAVLDKMTPLPLPKGDIGMSEDCLYLTVYSTNPAAGKKLPVMVWLYGGGFMMGSEVEYDASCLSGLNDVVVVIPNYRVGIFGFFSTGLNSPCSGNAGILDQQLALRWVRDNISAFGGNSENVTIFGQSAGGVSVHFHLVSPLSNGLFHKAISHSGQISMPALFNDDEKNERALEVIMKHFDIDRKDSSELLETLQTLSEDELLSANTALEKNKAQFTPMVDGNVFHKPPAEYLLNLEFPRVPYIIGCNSTEGSGMFTIFAFSNSDEISEEEARTSMPLQVSNEGWEELKKYYISNDDSVDRYRTLLSSVSHDALFAVPAMHDAKLHSESGAPVFVYLGDFRLNLHHDEKFRNALKKPASCICDHHDDVYLTFGFPLSPFDQPFDVKYSKEEEVLSRKWMTYLTNFAKTGNPNHGRSVEKQWPDFRTSEMLVLNHEIATKKNYMEEEIYFWKEKMPSYF